MYGFENYWKDRRTDTVIYIVHADNEKNVDDHGSNLKAGNNGTPEDLSIEEFARKYIRTRTEKEFEINHDIYSTLRRMSAQRSSDIFRTIYGTTKSDATDTRVSTVHDLYEYSLEEIIRYGKEQGVRMAPNASSRLKDIVNSANLPHLKEGLSWR